MEVLCRFFTCFLLVSEFPQNSRLGLCVDVDVDVSEHGWYNRLVYHPLCSPPSCLFQHAHGKRTNALQPESPGLDVLDTTFFRQKVFLTMWQVVSNVTSMDAPLL